MKRKIIKNLKKIFQKTCAIIMILGMMVTSLGLPPFINVLADTNNTKLVLDTNNNAISIDSTDTNMLIYKIDDTIVGTVKVKLDDDYQTPIINDGKAEFILPEYNNETYQVVVEVRPEEGYQTRNSYVYKGNSYLFPGDNNVGLDITENDSHIMDFTIEAANTSEPGPGPAQVIYPIVAKFSTVDGFVSADESGNISLPNEWTGGDVSFYAKVCEVSGNIAPDNGDTVCDQDTQENLRIDTIMPANREQINNTVESRGEGDEAVLVVDEDFLNYGKATVHLIKDGINGVVHLISEDLVFVRADAPLEMSYSVGSVDVNNAILTNTNNGRVFIFFGNTETTLIASGPKVARISAVTGAVRTLNDDGSATITLPDLNVETTTRITLTIELINESTITKTLDIVRTAITLRFNKADGNATLEAGYVMNKAYLYNNQNHNDEIFDAYLQVILYKDDMVAGYKQIKIDDEEIVNNLENNQSDAMELVGDNNIKLYGKHFNNTIEGVNRASVFLTNGPIDFDSDTLPSIEFGIGAGVQISWEVE